MTPSRVRRDSFMCDMTHSCVCHDAIHMCGMTYLYASRICVTQLIYMRDTAHAYVCHTSYVCDIPHTCDMTGSRMRYE